MAQFRTTADLVDSVLRRAGELTDGTSPYESQALDYLNQIHHTIISGGNEFGTDIDEPWTWAKAHEPIRIELQPKYETGTVALTKGSTAGTFSVAPSESMEGRFLFITGRDEKFKITHHEAGSTSLVLSAPYTDDTGSALSFKAIKLDYDLKSDYYITHEDSSRIDFSETSGVVLSVTINHGTGTPSQVATHIATQLNAAGASTYTCTYDDSTGLFTITSDGAGGGGIFSLLATGPNKHRNALIDFGFDYEDQTGALTYTGKYIKDGVVKLFDPIKVDRPNKYTSASGISLISEGKMNEEYPIRDVQEGIPTRAAKIHEHSDGRVTLRFNKYPEKKTKLEIEYIPIPHDLKDNAASIPLIPRSYSQILEFGAIYYILIDKEDSKAGGFLSLAQAKLKALVNKNRKEISGTNPRFGVVISRRDNLILRRKLIYGEPD